MKLMKKEIEEDIERARLEKLESLSFYNEDLTEEFFNALSNLTHLVELDLMGCKINNFSPSFRKLINLEILDLMDTGLSEFPKEITELNKLTKLDLSLNNIQKLPHELEKLENLEILDISHNSFKSVSDIAIISNLKKLKDLDLSGIELDDVSIVSEIKNLEKLSLAAMGLSYIPIEIFSLEKLISINLSLNNINVFPIGLTNLHNLNYIFLSNNILSELPTEIRNLKELNYIDLKDNNIQNFPLQLLDIPNLETLLLSGNPFAVNELSFEYALPDKKNILSLLNFDNLKFNSIKTNLSKKIFYLEHANNTVLISSQELYRTNTFRFSMQIFGNEKTQKIILKKIREQVENWLTKEKIEFDEDSSKNEKSKKKREFASRSFYYITNDKKDSRRIKIDFDRLLRFKEAGENTYFDNRSKRKIPVNDLLDYIGINEKELKREITKEEWKGKTFLTEIKIDNFKIFNYLQFTVSEHFNIILGRNGLGKTSLLQAITLGLLPLDNIDKSNNFEDYINMLHSDDKSELVLSWGEEYRRVYIFKNELNEEEYINFPQKLILAYGVNLNTNPELDHSEIVGKILYGNALPYSTKSIFSDYSTNFHDPLIILEKLVLAKNGSNSESIDKIIGLILNTLNHYLSLIEESGKIRLESISVNSHSAEPAKSGTMKSRDRLVKYILKEFDFRFIDINGNLLETRHLSEGYRDHILLVTDILIRILAARNEIFGKDEVEVTESFFKEVNGVILIDEFDRHLHPVWQRKLLSRFKEDFPKIQFILTTHNPMSILDRDGDEILELQEDEEKKIIVKRHYTGTKYTDIGMIYLKYFVNNIVSTELQKDLERFNELSLKKEYSNEYKELESKLRAANVGYTINDLRYWKFLDFLKRFPEKDPEQNNESPGDWDFTSEDWDNLVNELK